MEHVVRISLVDTVVEKLRHEVKTGAWPVGSKIPTEARLVSSLGVSRPSVREAVRALVQLGLLETRQGDGTYVVADDETVVALQSAIDAADESDVVAVRRALDVLAAAEAASRRSTTDVADLREALDGRRSAVASLDVARFVEHDVAFHLGIARASRNRLLLGLYQSFEGSLRCSVSRANLPEISADSEGALHQELLHAIERGDRAGATAAALKVLDDHEIQAHG